jgi:REP element-mobilizing transposase RayT
LTFSLADSIPSSLRGQWANEREAWLKVHPEPWTNETEREYHRRFSGAIERWLDAGHGACLLRSQDCAQIVAETLRHFEGERVVMISFAVMPNHVHALFVQNPEWPLEKLTQSWKRFAARQINKLLDRSGNFWQRDYFDRIVRDEKHFANCVRYIRRNPEKARLGKDEFILWESQTALGVL